MPSPSSIHIRATGSALGERVITNQDLEKLLPTSDAWIRDKIGIVERRWVASGTATSDLATRAGRQALTKAGWRAEDLDLIVVATSTSDHQSPGVGVRVQQKLGCRTIPACDIHNTSPGFLFALQAASGMMTAWPTVYRRTLVIGAEVHSPALDVSERGRTMAVIFGDGAGAVLLERDAEDGGIEHIILHSDGTHFNKLWCEAPGSAHRPWISAELISQGRAAPTMDGQLIFAQAVKCMTEVSQEILTALKLTLDDIDWVIPHQANLRIIENVAKNLTLPRAKVLTNIAEVGNTSAASIPIVLDQYLRASTIKRHDRILAMSFGSGLSWGAMVARV